MKKVFTVLSLIVLVVAGGSLMAGTYDDLPVSLNEEQANTPDHPIHVSLNNGINISLQGEESHSNVYCSGVGDLHGYRWEYDNGGVENNVLTVTSSPINTIHAPFSNGGNAIGGWKAKQTFYNWSFFPSKSGLTTLTFKKYYYSNSTVRNIDGFSPWKNPVETIQFTIQVVDDAMPAGSSN